MVWVCRGGGVFFCCFYGGAVGGWVVAFDLSSCARALHTPGPSREGRFEMLFLVGNEWVECGGFPSREGIKGCVTVRGAG